jgi:plastocyanin
MDTQQVGSSVPATSSLPHWRPILVWAAVAQILLNVALMAVNGEIVPPLIAMSVLLAVGVLVLGNRPRGGAAGLGIVSLLHLATSGPFLAEGLVHPESFWDFWLGWAIVLAAVLCVLAAVPVWRQKDDGSTRARSVSLAVGGLIVALGIAGGVATAAYESDTAQGGDIAVAARNVEFEPANLSAEAGEVAVFVDNKDSFRHTFSIDDLDVDLEVPGGKAARVEFTAEPGSYEFYCAVPGHEDMKGELVIE